MMAETPVLDPSFLHRLERLRLAAKRAMRGTHAGKRRSRNTGSSLEFADYRVYAPGDDLRQLDWNAYARSGKLFVKKFLDEQEVHISLYIDCSKSMTYGEPSKFQRAVQLAAALGYLSLHHLDYVSVYAFTDRIQSSLLSLHGKGGVHQLFSFLASLEPMGAGNINEALRSGRAVQGKPGISIVLSDFLFPSGYEQGIGFVQAARQEVALVQLLTGEERRPGYEGGLRLIDSETQEQREISFTPVLLAEYRRAVEAFQTKLASYAHRRGMHYFDVEPELPVEQVVLHLFRQSGLIR
ncbi:DUF58 domain-containing protein [Brevibacillus sp. B_LB10_24]|uniref:DUF58 domain-containing protein n=1 Tax=Brevibacillus sp. B_LB10_24 TaxID=3380645 RepID=UPI0038B85F07